MKRTRGSQLKRILQLIFRLSENYFGLTFREMLKEAGASRRTLYRDLDALAETGLRVEVEWAPTLRANRWRLRGLPARFEQMAKRRAV